MFEQFKLERIYGNSSSFDKKEAKFPDVFHMLISNLLN
jgi:hypothetical protein